MKEIKLSKGLVTIVDDEDYEWLSRYKWNAVSGGNTFYASRYEYHGDGTRTLWRMHRKIKGVTDPKILVDHKDKNGLNNTRDNLRETDKSQNAINSLRSENASGIYYDINRRRYKAFLLNPRTYVGTFKTYEAAFDARQQALLESSL